MNHDYSFTITLNPATILTYLAIWWLFGALCVIAWWAIQEGKAPDAWKPRTLLKLVPKALLYGPIMPFALADYAIFHARKQIRKQKHKHMIRRREAQYRRSQNS